MRRFPAFQASSLDSMSNVAHKDATWCASSRIKLQNLVFFICFGFSLKMKHMVTYPIRNQLNDQNTKTISAQRFFWAFSFLVQSHCTHLFYCNVLRPVALRQGFYRPFPFCVWPRKTWKNLDYKTLPFDISTVWTPFQYFGWARSIFSKRRECDDNQHFSFGRRSDEDLSWRWKGFKSAFG